MGGGVFWGEGSWRKRSGRERTLPFENRGQFPKQERSSKVSLTAVCDCRSTTHLRPTEYSANLLVRTCHVADRHFQAFGDSDFSARFAPLFYSVVIFPGNCRLTRLMFFSWSETTVLIVFVITALLWLFRDPGFIPGWGSLFADDFVDDGTVAVAMSSMLFFLPSKKPEFFRRSG